MTLAEKIAAALAAVVAKKDQIQALTNKMTALAEGDSPDESEALQIDQLSDDVERLAKDLETYRKAEAALARAALPAGSNDLSGMAAPALATRGHLQRKPGPHLFVRSAIAAFESHHTHEKLAEVIERRWPGQDDLLEASKLITGIGKAAQNPAMTSVPDWAGSLVRESWQGFMDLLGTEAIIPQIPMQRYTFEGGAPIKIPVRIDDWAAGNHMGAGFRQEGGPIRVGSAKLGTVTLPPYNMGVIGTFTMEMLQRSQIDFEAAVQRWMRQDTARVLDTAFLDANATVTNMRPAGLQSGLPAGDTAVSTGNDSQQILADMRGRITSMASQGLGRNPYWLMHPARAQGVAMSTTATGDLAFPTMASNTLANIPVRTSLYVPMDVVFLVDADELAFVGGNPEFSFSDQATIHEDDGMPFTANAVTGTSVLPIATGAAGAGVLATPARSFWQTYSGGIRSVWDASWLKLRAGAVQTITAVAW